MRTHLLVPILIIAGFHAQAAVEVSVARIEETRNRTFIEDKISRTPASLKVVLSLTGPEAESAVRYGNIKIDEAVDDKGTSLVMTNDRFHEAVKFKEYSNAFFLNSRFGPKSAPQADLELALSARAATKIARLRGSLELAGAGTVQTVELGGLDHPGKKALTLPKGAGVGITAVVAGTGPIRSLGLEITGDESAVESIEVVDASGKKVSNGMSSWSFNGGPVQKSLGLNQALTGSMKLVAKIAVGRNLTQVPFDLKNIQLP